MIRKHLDELIVTTLQQVQERLSEEKAREVLDEIHNALSALPDHTEMLT